MAQHAILRFEKHKGNPARPLEAHHERQKEQYASNVYTVPGQPQKLTHSQRTGESKVDCQTENIIVAGFQSLQKNFRCPDVSGLRLQAVPVLPDDRHTS